MDVSTWLRELDLEVYVQAFQANHIDAKVLPRLTADDLTALGITSIGHRRKLLDAIAGLDERRAAAATEPMALTGRPRLAERRQLTVLFCDLVGSTSLAAQLDPEDLREVMAAYHRATAAAVEHFGGHIAKYLGDGVLAYFGWPRAHEDDAERAVRAGLALVAAVARLEPHTDARLQARVGIATGQVVVGDLVGQGEARDEAVVGETPNLAARLQGMAAPGSVVISQATQRLISGVFELIDLGPQDLKGFPKALRAWRVEGQARAEGRFGARQARGLTPLVGREEENDLLLRRWRQACNGEGQVVLLSGEPGIGKSRLLRELLDRLTGESHLRVLYHCSPYHMTSPLHPVIEQLERNACFNPRDPPQVKLDRLEAHLARFTHRIDEIVPLVAALLGLPTEDRYPTPEVTPERQKQRTLEVLVDQLEDVAATEPVLLAYEDVHWIDPTTRDLLGLTIERIHRLPVLALMTFRPEFVPAWSGPHVTTLILSRLGRREGAAMVNRVVGNKALPGEVTAQIVAKTDGVPLFIEELTKAVLESGLLVDTGDRWALSGPLPPLAIPTTLHDSLLARLDRLAPAKEIAQIGAVLGREFSHELLAVVADRPRVDLEAALDQLVSSELIFRSGDPPKATYSFKHALVQDAAYGTLLKSRRQQLHARIVQALEAQFPEMVESQPAVLAHHSAEAGLTATAVEYRRRAARLAVAQSAHLEAIAEATKGLQLLADLPDNSERQRQELDLQLALGRGSLIAKGEAAPETGSAYARAVELCAQIGPTEDIFPALYGRYLFHFARGELFLAHGLANQFLDVAHNGNDSTAQATGTRIVGVTSLYLGRPSAARVYLKQALEQTPSDHSRGAVIYPYHSRVLCLSYLSATFLTLGYPDQAQSFIRQALIDAELLGHPESIAFAMAEAASFYHDIGDVQAVQEQAQALTALATEQGYPHFLAEGTLYQAWALGQRGGIDEAVGQIRQVLAGIRATCKGIGMPYRLLLLAGVHLRGRQVSDGLDASTEALSCVERTGERWFEAELHRVEGELLLALPDPAEPEAEARFRQALAVAREQEAKTWELRAAMSLAQLWRDQGRRTQAHDLLAPVHGWFNEGFDTADLKDAKALLEELS